MVYSGKHLHYISEILIDFDWFHHWLKGDYVQQRLLEICFEMMLIRKGIFSDALWSGIVKTIHANFGAQRKRSMSNHSNLTSSTFTLSYHVFSFEDWVKCGHQTVLLMLFRSCSQVATKRKGPSTRGTAPTTKSTPMYAWASLLSAKAFQVGTKRIEKCLTEDDRSIQAGTH